MCGIAGLVGTEPSETLRSNVAALTNAAIHRGPDDEGIVLFGRRGELSTSDTVEAPKVPWIAGLGHRRLSIIDLSAAGHQPMCDPSRRYWIVYNGEVYNFVDLRRELSALGHSFRSQTDTEVVLSAYIEWGPGCLHRFNGMWAFAIYDRHTGALFCARDRFGVKPFYFVLEGGRFAFASEIKQLLTLSWVRPGANRDRLADFFLWGLESHTDETFFADVRSLPGSHYLALSREELRRGTVEPLRYWEPAARPEMAETEAIAEFKDLLADSVRIRLRSDVPVGVTLSGGLDSSSVVCLAGEHRRGSHEVSPLDAFNVEFEGVRYSERGFAEAAAAKAGARMIVLRPSQADLARDWERFLWHMEEPFGGLTYFSNYQIYRLIREHGIPVVLSGQGGDELLLGYERYRTYDSLFRLKGLRSLEVLAEIAAARRRANMPLGKQVGYGLYFSMPWLRAARRRRLVRPILNRGFFREYAGRSEHLRATMAHRDRLALQRSELFHYQLPHLLRHEDRVSMAHSVETRLPFLDYRLLELVIGQPTSLLFRDGWSKHILRRAMEGVLPAEVQYRTDKMGYETPTGRLIRENKNVFLPLLARHRGDRVLDVPVIERAFESDTLDQRLLCAAVTYLGWKDAFAVA